MSIVSHIMSIVSHIMSIVSHIMSIVSHIMSIVSHIMSIVSHIMSMCFTAWLWFWGFRLTATKKQTGGLGYFLYMHLVDDYSLAVNLNNIQLLSICPVKIHKINTDFVGIFSKEA